MFREEVRVKRIPMHESTGNAFHGSQTTSEARGLTPFRSLRRIVFEKVPSLDRVLNKAQSWIATKDRPFDEKDDDQDDHLSADDEVDRESDHDGEFADGEKDDVDPYAENFDPAIGEEVELMLVAACQGVSQKTGSVSTHQIDHTPKDVTRRQRSRPKRAVTMGVHHGAPDLPAPLPKR